MSYPSQDRHLDAAQKRHSEVAQATRPVEPPLEPIPDWELDGWLGFYTKIAALALFAGALMWVIRPW